jgi:hypothetical protein
LDNFGIAYSGTATAAQVEIGDDRIFVDQRSREPGGGTVAATR